MVLEAIVVPESWEKRPSRMLVIGFTYAIVGMFLGLWVFGKYASIAGIFLTTIPLVVIMYRAINCEEEKGLQICNESTLMKEHRHILWFFLYLFIGMVLAYCFMFAFLPVDIVNKACSSQIETVNSIGTSIAATETVNSIGGSIAATGSAFSPTDKLVLIIGNNIRVLAFCILFSLIYGAGAIFILTWNASVIGVAIGNLMREGLKKVAEDVQSPTLINYFTVLPLGLTYLVHGIPEVASYFLGSLAGGIISVAVSCHHYRSPRFWHIILDSVDLMIVSFAVLVAAAVIEVYVTPILLT